MRKNSEWTAQERAEFDVAQTAWLMRPENRVPATGPVGDDYEDGDFRCDVDGKLWLLHDGRWHQIIDSKSQKKHA